MRKALICIFAVLTALYADAASIPEGQDSTSLRNRVLEQMDAYLEAMDHMDIKDAEEEADFMISCVQDSSLRNDVAEKAYWHFRDSKVMGSENVAVHIFDRWFEDFDAVFNNIDDFEEARFYAYINRRSLIGAKAEQLTFINENGDSLSIPFPNGRRSVIYFYSTSCPKCLYTSIKLRELFKTLNPDVDFFAIYAGEDDTAWASYRKRELEISSSNGAVYHLRGADDDFVGAYGVIQTPRLFLLSGDGTIIGRNLDANALSTLLCGIVHNFVENSR